jgi:hypothetical protein
MAHGGLRSIFMGSLNEREGSRSYKNFVVQDRIKNFKVFLQFLNYEIISVLHKHCRELIRQKAKKEMQTNCNLI